MDPTIIAAMISAVASIGSSLLEKWNGSAGDVAKLDEQVAKFYDTLRAGLNSNSVKILRRMEDGQNRAVSEIFPVVYPGFGGDTNAVMHEFEYRLQYMVSLGVLTRPGTEYWITPLGMRFLHQARLKRDYISVLFG